MNSRLLSIALLLCCLLGAAAHGENLDQLPGWAGERASDVVPLFLRSCPRLGAAFRPACAAAAALPPRDEAAARGFFETMFRPTLLGRAMTTGYFEIDIVASRTRGGPYQWPLLRPPRDPQRYSRGEILGGALAGQGLEILWFASAADLYFVQLQGSARVRLTDGSLIRVGGAAQNGRPSVPVAQLFRNAISGSDLSIPGLRAWSAAHPAQAQAVVSRDAAYFFMQERHVPPDQGPPGALGVPLTPLRSVAVDRRYIPLGAPVWLDTRISATGERLRRLMLAQDSGEPISGPAHIDVFFGPGAPAEAVGGRQHADADVWVLLPR